MRTVNPKMYILAGVLAILVLALSGCARPGRTCGAGGRSRHGHRSRG